MTAARWGKSAGAYAKFSFIFDKSLPVIVQSNAPISDAAYIRDVIAYANENGLKGGNWYKKVSVSPQDNGTVMVKVKAAFAPELATQTIPCYNIFEILRAIERGDLKPGDRCHCEDSLEDVNTALKTKDLKIQNFGGTLIEIMRL